MNVRTSILRGVEGAAETHEAFRSREQHGNGLSAIDVFGMIDDLGIPLLFEPLDELLGACVRVSSTEVGILVTSRRDLHMQRFTAAHELGHFVLEHEGSLDREIRMPGEAPDRDPVELEANSFAAELLLPKWLVKAAARRRGWWGENSLRNPLDVYQLSLRLAASYTATCWTLASHDFIDRESADALIGDGKRLKAVKQQLLQGAPLEDPWADVWLLRREDDGATLDAGPSDIFVFDLEEPAATGRRWEFAGALEQGFSLIDDVSHFDDGVVGGASARRVILGAPPSGVYDLCLPLRRSFARGLGSAVQSSVFHLCVSTEGSREKRRAPVSGASSPMTIH